MEISDGEVLYRYAYPKVLPEGQDELPVSIFTDTEMSCDWSHYQKTPESSPHVAHGRSLIIAISICDEIRNPKKLGIVVPEMVQQVLHDPTEEVTGDPFTPNESHSLIKGRKKAIVTIAIRDNAKLIRK